MALLVELELGLLGVDHERAAALARALQRGGGLAGDAQRLAPGLDGGLAAGEDAVDALVVKALVGADDRAVEGRARRHRACLLYTSWNHPQGAGPDESNSALVEFSLTEEAGGTRLTVLENGIGAVAHDEQGKTRYLEQHEHGWEKHLGELLEDVYKRQDSR